MIGFNRFVQAAASGVLILLPTIVWAQNADQNTPNNQQMPDLSKLQWYLQPVGGIDEANCQTCLDMGAVWKIIKKGGSPRTRVLMLEAVPSEGLTKSSQLVHGHFDLPKNVPIILNQGRDTDKKTKKARWVGSHHDLQMLGILAARAHGEGGVKGIVPGVSVKLAYWNDLKKEIDIVSNRRARSSASESEVKKPDCSNLSSQVCAQVRELWKRRSVSGIQPSASVNNETVGPTLQQAVIDRQIAPIVSVASAVSSELPGTKLHDPNKHLKYLGRFKSHIDRANASNAFRDRRDGRSRGILFLLAAGNNAHKIRNNRGVSRRRIQQNLPVTARDNVIIVGAVAKNKTRAVYSDFYSRKNDSDITFVDVYAPSTKRIKNRIGKNVLEAHRTSFDANAQTDACKNAFQFRISSIKKKFENIEDILEQESFVRRIEEELTSQIGDEVLTTTNWKSGDDCGQNGAGYTKISGGTSAATTITAGLAALIHEINPELTASEIKKIIVGTAGEHDDFSPRSQAPVVKIRYIQPIKAIRKAADQVVLQWRDYWERFYSGTSADEEEWENSHGGYYDHPKFVSLERSNTSGTLKCFLGKASSSARAKSDKVAGQIACNSYAQFGTAYVRHAKALRARYKSVKIDVFPVESKAYLDQEAKPVTELKDLKSGQDSSHNVEILGYSANPNGTLLKTQFLQRFRGYGHNNSEDPEFCDWVKKTVEFVLLHKGNTGANKTESTDATNEPAQSYWWHVRQEKTEVLRDVEANSCT